MALLVEQAIDGGSTETEQETSGLGVKGQVSEAFERFDENGQVRDEAFTAEPVGGLPDGHECLVHLVCVKAGPRSFLNGQLRGGRWLMIQFPGRRRATSRTKLFRGRRVDE